ncbi:MAG: hypothetical protein ICV60_06290 [Pyrinomonadaceae bacterium]|nr:hypothetical protein [Pyrinomonadaceae bacterium]
MKKGDTGRCGRPSSFMTNGIGKLHFDFGAESFILPVALSFFSSGILKSVAVKIAQVQMAQQLNGKD